MKKLLLLKDIPAYTESFELSNDVWNIVRRWDHFAKRTVGEQFVRSVDSISANIAEGFDRYHKKDRSRFYYNARGSVFESQDWLKKAKIRGLVGEKEYELIIEKLRELPKEINRLIKLTSTSLKV